MQLFGQAILWLVLLALPIAQAAKSIAVQRSGLAGINGFTFYDPYCAAACNRFFSNFKLSCSTMASGMVMHGMTMTSVTTPDCRASDHAFLSSVAYCINSTCSAEHVSARTIDRFWATEITGDVRVLPRWTYEVVLANITQPPTRVANGTTLTQTALVNQTRWHSIYNAMWFFFRETRLESIFGLTICLTAFALPIVLTWSKLVPFASSLIVKIRPWLDQSLVGTYHDRALPYLLGNVPTLGQSLYIALLVVLNVVLTAVDYKTATPKLMNAWSTNHWQELVEYIFYRTGVLSFCMLPIVLLFSSRNNILLWMTDWSHATYMLLHRWTARIFFIQALLHSILGLILYKNEGTYATNLKETYWIWGCVATVAAVIIILTSVLYIRRNAYEIFLVGHIVLAVICLVGLWYHVDLQFEGTFGYETWLYMSFAVWGFDRLVRVVRLLSTGFRPATVTDIGSNISRVDIPGISWRVQGRHAYVYFPTLSPDQPWENHPFSLMSTAMLKSNNVLDSSTSISSEDTKEGSAKLPHIKDKAVRVRQASPGVAILVRKHQGASRLLGSMREVLTLLDGPYSNSVTISTTKGDRLLLIGGGIGITGLVPFIGTRENVKFYYSVKEVDSCLLEELSGALQSLQEKEVRVGQRLNIDQLLRAEADAGWTKIGIVACGPAEMCDVIRATTTRLGKELAGRVTFDLRVDAFSW